MRSHGNELIVSRGETFTIDREIVNRDGTPYVISSRLNNPYFRVTVTDNLYESESEYKVNFWLKIDPKFTPMFIDTTPIDLTRFKGTPNPDAEPLYNSWDDLAGIPPSGYLDGKLPSLTYEKGDAVFYFGDDYRYYDETGWHPYKLEIVKSFLNSTTAEWIEHDYYYSIYLVAGVAKDGEVVTFDRMIPILSPTKLTVLSNLNGGY